jgi:hypothetical protein
MKSRNTISTIKAYYTHAVYQYRDKRQSIYVLMKMIRDFVNPSVYDYCFNHKVIFPSSKRSSILPVYIHREIQKTIFNSQIIWRKPTSNFVA